MVFNVWQTVIEALLAFSYIFVLFIIITSKVKTFESAFYLMFVATGFADVTSLFSSCFHRLNRDAGFSPNYRYVVIFFTIVSGTAFAGHMIGNVLITVNRYSSLCLAQKYDKLWMRQKVWKIIVLQYIIAFAAFIHTVRAKLVYVQNEDGSFTYIGTEKNVDLSSDSDDNTASILSTEQTRPPQGCVEDSRKQHQEVIDAMKAAAVRTNRSIYVGICLIYCIITVNLNIRLLLEWHRLSNFGDISRHGRHEKGLVLYIVSVFVFTMLMCSQQITRGVAVFTDNTTLNSWATAQFYWINDVMVSIPPTSLLILSSELRRDIVNFFRCQRQRSPTSVSAFN